MFFNNVIYYGDDFRFHKGSVEIGNGRIIGITEGKLPDEDPHLLIPGLVDIHTHGNSGYDFTDGNYDGLCKIARYMAVNGITSFSPASMTVPEDTLVRAYKTAARYKKEKLPGHSKLAGITMEGPFFSEKYKGAQSAGYLRLPDAEMFDRLNDASENLIRIACVAPELNGALQFIAGVSGKAVVSIAHTASDYGTAVEAIKCGARHLTHLFNGMPPMLHRTPGVIGAAADDPRVTAELICDGIHVHESMVRAAFKLFGSERIVLISDSVRACGMPDGDYTLGGQKISKQGRVAALENGTFAGSVTGLFECLKNAILFGIPREAAIRAASYNPASVLGISDDTGSIGIGKAADLILCKQDLTIEEVYINGCPVMDI